MKRLNCWLCAVAGLALASLVLSSLANAQQRSGQWGQRPENAVDVTADGTLKGLSPAVAQVLGGRGEQWLVKVPPVQQISYNAQAEPDWLRPGMFVEFTAEFDAKGLATEPLKQLSVFTPSAEQPLGAVANSGLGGAVDDLFKSVAPAEEKKPPQQTVSLKVAGQIVGMRDGKLSVAAGNANVAAALDEKCSISVTVNDASLARPDDTVRIVGWRLPNDPAHIYATRLTINAKEPLTSKRAATEKVAAKPPAKRKAAPVPGAPATAPTGKEALDAAIADLENPAAGDQ